MFCLLFMTLSENILSFSLENSSYISESMCRICQFRNASLPKACVKRLKRREQAACVCTFHLAMRIKCLFPRHSISLMYFLCIEMELVRLSRNHSWTLSGRRHITVCLAGLDMHSICQLCSYFGGVLPTSYIHFSFMTS